MSLNREDVWKKLKEIALEDGIITLDEELLIDAVVKDSEYLDTVLTSALEDTVITLEEQQFIEETIQNIEHKALDLAKSDLHLSDEEINLLQKLTQLFRQLKPSAIGPYSPVKRAGQFLYVSGQIALIPGTKLLVNRSIEAETRQALNNMKSLVEGAGGSFEQAIKMTIFMTDINDYGKINGIYSEFFGTSKPARAAVEVSNLPASANVEIEGIFYLE